MFIKAGFKFGISYVNPAYVLHKQYYAGFINKSGKIISILSEQRFSNTEKVSSYTYKK